MGWFEKREHKRLIKDIRRAAEHGGYGPIVNLGGGLPGGYRGPIRRAIRPVPGPATASSRTPPPPQPSSGKPQPQTARASRAQPPPPPRTLWRRGM